MEYKDLFNEELKIADTAEKLLNSELYTKEMEEFSKIREFVETFPIEKYIKR